MKQIYRSLILLFLIINAFSQTNQSQPNKSSIQKHTICGYISDKETGERLTGVIIQEETSNAIAISNTYGFYSITNSEGSVKLKYSYLGYNFERKELYLTGNTEINIQLSPSTVELKEVTINDKTNRKHIESTQMGINELQIKNIKSFPVLIGENDIMKTLQLLPGIQQGNEGSSSLYVRGGSSDQNMILLDGAPVYNVNHLFGYISTFNDDAIQSVNVLKGGIPARYGGRLSSVVDIKMKEGNNKKFAAQIAVGTLASRLTLEGPIINENTSFIFSARRTYFDLLTRPFMKLFSSPDNKFDMYYYFQDYNLKLNHTFSSKSHLFLSIYSGKDVISSEQKSIYNKNVISETGEVKWGNITATTRWNYKITDKLFSNATFIFSQYKIHYSDNTIIKDTNQITQNFYDKYESGIHDYGAKLDFDYYLNTNHTIRFGIHSTLHHFNPGYLTESSSIENVLNSQTDTTTKLKNIHLIENDVYVEDEIRINNRLKTNIGLRYSAANVQNKTYQSFQPRVSLRYLITENWSAKAAWSVMNQNLNLLTGSSSIGIPMDLWIPATNKLKPQRSSVFSIGTLCGFDNNIEISTELYYKTMQNVIDYKDGTSYTFADQDWEKKIEQGEGRAYGAEFLVEKKTGKTFGWLGYTLAKSTRHFDNINNGNWFPYQYNRMHNLNLVIAHRFSDRFEIGATWLVSSGRLLTVNNQKYPSYLEPGKYAESFDSRNNFQTPLYHRLDLSMRFSKQKKWGVRTWTLGCYNVYNHKNPSVMYVENNNPKQLASLPVIPSITYSFKFQKKQTVIKEDNDIIYETPNNNTIKYGVKTITKDTFSINPITSPNNITSNPELTNKGRKMVSLGLSYQLRNAHGLWMIIDFTSGKFRTQHFALGSVFTLTYIKNFNADTIVSKYLFQYGILNRYYIGNKKIKPFIQVTPTIFLGTHNAQIIGNILVPFGCGASCFINKKVAVEAFLLENLLRLKNNLNLKFGIQLYFK